MRCAGAVVLTLALGTLALSPVACSKGAKANKVPVTTSSRKALKQYLKGRDLAEKLRAADAREHYAAAANLDPGFALAYLGLATTGPTAAEVLAALRRAAELADGASAAEAHMIRAAEATVNGRPDEQLGHLRALVTMYPEDERAHNLLGLFHFGRQEWREAAIEFKKAIAINPEFSQPYNLLGYSLRSLDDYAGAEKAFTAYVRLIPDEPNPYDSYAELLMKMGRFRESIAQYERALAINPNFVPSYIGIGNNHIFLGESRQARNSFTKLAFIARNDGERRQALVWTAISYLHEGNTAAALAEVGRMYEIARNAEDRIGMAGDLNLMGNVLLDAGRPEEAAAEFEGAVETAQRAIATADVKETVRRNALFNLARVALLRNNIPAAESAAEGYRALVEERRIPFEVRQDHELFGLIALAKREYAAAISELELANQQDPRVLFNLSNAYAGAGRSREARQALERAANFNALSLNYAFVRTKALTQLNAR